MIGVGSSLTSGVVDSKYSASFDGTDDYIDTNQTFQSVFVGDYSISFWMKPSLGRTQDRFVFSAFKGTTGADVHQVYFEMRSNGTPRFVMTGNSDVGEWHVDGGSGFAFDAGAASSWTHFLITVDLQSSGDSIVKIYVNGVNKVDGDSEIGNLTSAKHAEYSSNVNLVLGARNLDGTIGKRYTGGIDEFAIFNTVLDSDAAVAVYNGGSPLNLTFDQGNYDNSPALQAYYRMGNGLFDDKEQGSIHDQDNPGFGNNLVANADFSTNEAEDQTYLNGGLQFDSWVEGQHSGLRKYELTSDGEGVRCTIETAADEPYHNRIYQNVSSSLTVGDLYEYEIDVLCSKAGTFRVGIQENNSTNSNTTQNVTVAANQRTIFKEVFKCVYSTAQVIHLWPYDSSFNQAGEFYEIRNPKLRKLNGKPSLTSGGVTFSSDTP